MKKMHRQEFLVTMILIVLGISVIGYAVVQTLDTDGFVEVDVIEVFDTTVAIGSECQAIIAYTTPYNAESIVLGKEKIILNRPNSHDVFVTVMDSFNISIEGMFITEVDEEQYYAELVLRDDVKELRLDVKPSDGTAIALRADAPIYISENLLEEMGENICTE